MTPREADVAFVLEGLEGVRAVHAFRGDATLDFAIRVDSIKATVRAHAALVRVVTHVDCERVLFHREAMPARRAEKATLLVLSPDERAAAKARVGLSPPPVSPTSPALAAYGALPPAARGERKRILVHDADPAIARAVKAAAPLAERIVVEPRLGPATHLAMTEPFDLVLCDVRFAFGPNGLLSALHRLDAAGAERATLVANPDDLDFADRELRLLGLFCTFLERPVDVETLAFLVTHGALYAERWTRPVPG